MIKRTCTKKDAHTISTLYKSLVRPTLEYNMQEWNPFLQNDIILLENLQHRATKLLTGFENESL